MVRHLTVIILILCFIQACSPHKDQWGKTVFRYNEAAGITTLDPAFARDQTVIWATNQLFNGLVQLDDYLAVQPCVALNWEIADSGRLYIFHLRQDVYFHNNPCFKSGKGRRVVASDFVYSFNRIVDPVVASPGAWIFSGIRTGDSISAFQAVDDSTLHIHLRKSFPPFLSVLSMAYCSVVPEEAIHVYGVDFRRNPVGTGPFRFGMWEEGNKLVMLKNHNYFEQENGQKLPFLDAVSVTFIPDKQSVFLEFVKGNLDFISGMDPTYKDELLTRDGQLRPKYSTTIRLITQPYLNTEYLGFVVDPDSTGKAGPLSDKRVRQAINMSFDRKRMIRYLRNNIGMAGLHGITPAGLPSFDSSRVYYDYDPSRAAGLLSAAGYPHGKGLGIVKVASTPDYLDICKYIQHQAGNLGIDLSIEVMQPAAVKEMKAYARLPFFRASWIADYPDAENYLAMFYSSNFCPTGPNYTHFSDHRYDSLYEKAMSTVDDEERYTLYRQMEEIMMDQSPVIILYYDQVLRFVSRNVEGLGSNPMNLLTLKRVIKKQ